MEVINWRLKFQKRVQGSTRRCFVEKISMLESMYEIYHQVATKFKRRVWQWKERNNKIKVN